MSETQGAVPVALITGASSGIGEATARLFASHGYATVLTARRKDRLDVLASEITANGGEALAIPTDVTHFEDIQICVALTLERYKRIDVLINNAGFGRLKWLEQLDPKDDIDAQLQVNLRGAIYAAWAVIPTMIKNGKGHIINIDSLAGLIGMPTYSVYAATKFGLRGFNEALRRELLPWGIHVSIIYPGGVETEFTQHTGARRKTNFATPKRVRLSAEDVARTAFRMVQHPRRQAIMPGYMAAVLWVNSLLPGLVDALVDRLFVRRERDIKKISTL
ncbi:MAG: SDR family NAD(P)-dependent oxidoreductase [Chloroflexi bacterium]|nr:SDR family NAD(P)-dependent oxidoreductase [Chloroflexota bacterium]